MKKLFTLLFVLLLGLNFMACDGGGDDTKDSNTTTYYSISGQVTLEGSGLSHVTVELKGAATNSAITDSSGNYTFGYLSNGDYTLTPIESGYTYDNSSLSITVNSANITGQNFAATKNNSVNLSLHYTLPDQTHYEENYPENDVADEAGILFSDYTLSTGITYNSEGDTVSGYALSQFVDKNTVNATIYDPDSKFDTTDDDGRTMYSVVVVSNNDGFCNRTKFTGAGYYNADLRWDQFAAGYLLDLNYSAKVFFEATLSGDIAKMFNNKYSYDIRMLRKIDVQRPDTDGTLITFEVGATSDSYVDDTTYTTETGLSTTKFNVTTLTFTNPDGTVTYTDVKAISLDQFITDYVLDTATAQTCTYDIVAVDGFSRTGFAYADLSSFYYIVDYDFICQVSGGAQSSGTKVNFPVRIEMVTSDGNPVADYDNANCNPPAYAVIE